MTHGERIVAEAREWIGTRFHHGQAAKQIGCDCGGLVIGVLRELGICDASAELHGLPHILPQGYMRAAVSKFAARIPKTTKFLAGDILLFEVGGVEQHAAIWTDSPDFSMVHSLDTLGRVAEEPMQQGWRKRVSSAWRVQI